MKTLNKIDKIVHPCLKDHPTYGVYSKEVDLSKCPGVIWFHIITDKFKNMSNNKRRAFLSGRMDTISHIKFSTSFGKSYELIDMWPVYDETGIWLRLSVGYSDSYDGAIITHGLESIVHSLTV
jgi:hypothetical protein